MRDDSTEEIQCSRHNGTMSVTPPLAFCCSPPSFLRVCRLIPALPLLLRRRCCASHLSSSDGRKKVRHAAPRHRLQSSRPHATLLVRICVFGLVPSLRVVFSLLCVRCPSAWISLFCWPFWPFTLFLARADHHHQTILPSRRRTKG